ncbi:MAG: zinc ABC transporter substrate-binding protein [Lachnospiraceae bacterium]|nr:zinc ABC transporter substrate-binding protein [Lachnospiraceae bacterium]
MKKIFTYLLVAVMMTGILGGCSSSNGAAAGKEKLSIVVTIFPEYDWVMNVLGDNPAGVEVTLLLDNGVDLHSYQPTVDDIMKIANCDLFIYVGGESDEWVDDALSEAVNKDMIVIDLLEELGDTVKEEEIVEGMQEEDEHEHHHDHDDEDEDEHHHDEDEEEEGPEYDEHVWLSLKNAAVITESISTALQTIDSANANVYAENSAAYIKELSALDDEYTEAVKNASGNTLLFGDRFPFRYMTDDYDLHYYAAFVGCSAESEASFETITFLAGKVDELGLNCVLTIEGKDHSIAETIVQNTASKDQKVLTLDSMQSITSKDIADGVTYLSVMSSNLEVLKEALSY